jgi:hypothetical protein
MSTVTPAEMSVHWDLVSLVPDELVDPFDVFADDDNLGLLADELDAAGASDPCVSLADWLAIQASIYCSRPGSASKWLGGKIRELVDFAVRHGATTPDQLEERMRLEDLERDELIAEQGRVAGFDAAMGHQPSSWLGHFA